jgi:SsrA-binding protein
MSKTIVTNKKAYYEFLILETFDAGVVLTGTEVKSIREGKINLTDAYCFIERSELFIRNLHISEYKLGNIYNHEPKRIRKLLLKRIEIKKLANKIKEKGLTIIPLKVYFSETGFAKIQIGLGKGKKLHDKRDSIKEKDLKREMQRD